MLSFTIGAASIALFVNGVFYSIDESHINYQPLREELKKPADERDLVTIASLVTVKKAICHLTAGLVEIMEDEILYDGKTVNNYMTTRMLDLLRDGFDVKPWALFMDNVMTNPAEYARDELYEWMERADMPITPDGHFLAFKKVRADYTDCHTGKFDHSPGTVVEMDRGDCDPIRTNTCSTGFHFCSADYLGSFGGQRVVIVKINPRDVTSIPNDYSFTKGRTCRYEVVAELTSQSMAYEKCWKTGLVDLEDPAEFPADVLQNIKLPTPALNEPAEVTEAYEAGQQTKPMGSIEALALDRAEQAEQDMTDADKADTTPQASRVPTPKQLEKAAAKKIEKASKPKKKTKKKASNEVFETTSGAKFTGKQVLKALDGASTRAAARALGIGESTLRGWKKKLENKA